MINILFYGKKHNANVTALGNTIFYGNVKGGANIHIKTKVSYSTLFGWHLYPFIKICPCFDAVCVIMFSHDRWSVQQASFKVCGKDILIWQYFRVYQMHAIQWTKVMLTLSFSIFCYLPLFRRQLIGKFPMKYFIYLAYSVSRYTAHVTLLFIDFGKLYKS